METSPTHVRNALARSCLCGRFLHVFPGLRIAILGQCLVRGRIPRKRFFMSLFHPDLGAANEDPADIDGRCCRGGHIA